MKRNKQNPDFLHIGHHIIRWYQKNGRDLPFRKTKDPYKIWICEIVFQQTRIEQGLGHYERFIERFPNIQSLAIAEIDEVLLYWKGLGYYSRALNIHKASQQIVNDFEGRFPHQYDDILQLKGVGKYTAAAISSICFDGQLPAIDGNFYRVLSRIFADDFDVSNSKAFSYFSELALQIMPNGKAGEFNQAMMDLGSQVCKPKNPLCEICPANKDCTAFNTNTIQQFPVKKKKVKPTDLSLKYYFINYKEEFLIRQRGTDFIWKKLYEFPTEIPKSFEAFITRSETVTHQLTHKNLTIELTKIELDEEKSFKNFAKDHGFLVIDFEGSHDKSFPKPLELYIKRAFETDKY